MTILFFSSTGNSLFIAKSLGGTLQSIPQLIKNQKYEIKDDVIGIISPVYFLTLPLLVKEYLSKATLNADYIFGILTYGSNCGATTSQLQKLLKKNGNGLHYAAHLLMVDNYLTGFKIEDELALLPNKDITGHFAKIKEDIDKKLHAMPHNNVMWRTISHILDKTQITPASRNSFDKKFTVTDRCNRCKVCSRVCPVSNIEVKEKPIFLHHCESCLACAHNCPQKAIQVKGQKSEERFRNENVKLNELIKANDVQ